MLLVSRTLDGLSVKAIGVAHQHAIYQKVGEFFPCASIVIDVIDVSTESVL